MKDPNVFRSFSNGNAFPANAAVNASTSTSFDGTELDVDELDQYMGFLQALMVESGLIPNGSSESGSGTPPVSSQLVQSLRNMIQNGAWNAYYNGTNWIYLTAAKAFRFVIDDVNERIRFDYAVAGAAGGIITWLQGPYIDQNGFVGAINSPFLHIQDQKTSGTNGGTFTSGAWQDRTLNTVVTNTITGASLAANVITLPAGTYYLESYANAIGVDSHKAKLYNNTDASDEIIGTSEETGNAISVNTKSYVSGIFTIAASKDFKLQHQCDTTRATVGYGQSSGYSVIEIYADVKLWKIG